MEKYWLDIEGSIEIDVEHDEFLEKFYEWLEANGWSFAGVTKESEE